MVGFYNIPGVTVVRPVRKDMFGLTCPTITVYRAGYIAASIMLIGMQIVPYFGFRDILFIYTIALRLTLIRWTDLLKDICHKKQA